MIFVRKVPKFYIIIGRKIFFAEFAPSTPVLYAYVCHKKFGMSSDLNSQLACDAEIPVETGVHRLTCTCAIMDLMTSKYYWPVLDKNTMI